jgi:protein-S-isoprenylcysteine O-methyltransferase Ste14
MYYLVLQFIVILIAVIWLTTSPYPLPKRIGITMTARGLILGIFEWLVVFQVFRIINFSWKDSLFDVIFICSGLITTVIGAILAIWARLTMKNNWGVPAVHDIKRQNKLVTNGPFRFSRNPIYVGLLLMFIGIEIALRSYFLILIIPAFLFAEMIIKKEEVLLEKHFGKKYLEYKKRVPKFI